MSSKNGASSARVRLLEDVGIAADALNEELHRAEEMIRKKAFGVCAEIVLRSGLEVENGYQDEQSWYDSLLFGKLDGEWQLYLQAGHSDDEPEALRRTDLFSASLELRMLAAKSIPKLVLALEDKRSERHNNIVRMTDELSKFLDDFGRDVVES